MPDEPLSPTGDAPGGRAFQNQPHGHLHPQPACAARPAARNQAGNAPGRSESLRGCVTSSHPTGNADQLLQGLQGLVLHLHAISGDLPADLPARQALERWLQSADHLVAQGCADSRLHAQQGPSGVVALLMSMASVGPAAAQPWRLRVRLGRAERPLRDGLQQALGQLACDHVRHACSAAGASAVTVALDSGRDGLTLRVRDNGCWHAPHAGRTPPPAAQASLREEAARLNARLRLWHWPGAGAELELKVPALQAYVPNARTS